MKKESIRTPPEVVKRRGYYRQSRHGTIQTETEIPPQPAGMTQDAKKAWLWLTPILENAGLITEMDALSLRILCDSVGIYLKACRQINKQGLTVEGSSKFGRKMERNPAVAVRDSAWDQIYKMCRNFGLTPASRNGLHPSTSKQEDDVAQILKITSA